MTEIIHSGNKFVVEIKGIHKVLAMKRFLEIPIGHVKGVWRDPDTVQGWMSEMNVLETKIPGLVVAGTFHHHRDRVFWDVKDPENTIVMDLHEEPYAKLVIEVDDPVGSIKLIENVLASVVM